MRRLGLVLAGIIVGALHVAPASAMGGLNPSCKQWPAGGQPTQAATWGYNCLRMYSTFPTLNTVDVNNTGKAGYDWYVATGWPNVPSGGACNGWSTQAVIPSTQFASSAGNLVFNGALALGGGTSMMTAAYNSSPISYVGSAVGSGAAGFYVDFSIAFSSAQMIPAPANGAEPVVWSMPIEFLANTIAPTDYFTELDYGEAINSSNPVTFNMAVNEWTCSGYHEVNSGNRAVSITGLTTTNLNDYQTLLVPMAKNGGTGLIDRWINNVEQTGAELTYSTGGSPGQGITRTGALTELENMHYVFFMATGNNGSPTYNGWPLTVGAFSLWTP